MTVAVITGDVPPLGTLGANGAGIRAWGLAAALRRLGHAAVLVYPEEHLGASERPAVPHHVAVARAEIPRCVWEWERGEALFDDGGMRHTIRAVIFQHWGVMAEVVRGMTPEEARLPMAVDLAGPHLLERHYGGGHEARHSLRDKLAALARADVATVGGRRQLAWFAPFLATAWGAQPGTPTGGAAGIEALFEGRVAPADFYIDDLLPVAPWPFRDRERPVILYSGALLPWQDATWAIRETLSFLDDLGRGELLILGAMFPGVRGGAAFAALERELNLHPRVRRIGRVPFRDALSAAAGADAALDLMAPNPERMLAMPTRTFVGRRLGLPTLHASYGECAPWFAGGVEGTGWALGPGDCGALRAALEEVAGARGAAARERRQEASSRAPAVDVMQAGAQRAAAAFVPWLERIARGGRRPQVVRDVPVLDRATARRMAREAGEALGLREEVRAAIDEGLAMVIAEDAHAVVAPFASRAEAAGRAGIVPVPMDAGAGAAAATRGGGAGISEERQATSGGRTRDLRRIVTAMCVPFVWVAGFLAALWLALVAPIGRRRRGK